MHTTVAHLELNLNEGCKPSAFTIELFRYPIELLW